MNEIVIDDKKSNDKIVLKNFKNDYGESPIFLKCDLLISIGGFEKKQFIDMEYNELKQFCLQLEKLKNNDIKNACLNNIDSVFQIQLQRENFDQIKISGVFHNSAHTASLSFNFDSDLTFVQGIIDQINNLEREFI